MPIPDADRLYATARRRLADLVREATPEELARRVPATPAWTVQEAVAHLTGVPPTTRAA